MAATFSWPRECRFSLPLPGVAVACGREGLPCDGEVGGEKRAAVGACESESEREGEGGGLDTLGWGRDRWMGECEETGWLVGDVGLLIVVERARGLAWSWPGVGDFERERRKEGREGMAKEGVRGVRGLRGVGEVGVVVSRGVVCCRVRGLDVVGGEWD
jgi:hypothetical protein